MTTRPTTSRSTIAHPKGAIELRAGSSWSPAALAGLVLVVGRRLWSHLWLMLAIAAGFVVAIALVVSIPVYAEAVGYRVLRDEFAGGTVGTNRPPFAFLYRYLGGQSGLITWDTYQRSNAFMYGSIDRALGLPIERRIRYVSTEKLPLRPEGTTGQPLLRVNLAFATDVERHIQLIDGRMPQVVTDGPPEVLIAEELASRLGFQIDEIYVVSGMNEREAGPDLPVRIAGVWRPIDPADPYWFYPPDTFVETLLMPEESYAATVVHGNPRGIFVAVWYLLADGSGIRSNHVPGFAARVEQSVEQAGAVLRGMLLDVSPVSALERHQERVQRLTVILTVFSIPILGLVAYFVILVSQLIIQRQSNEIAVLRSRGTSRLQVLGVYLLEGVLLGGAALLIGLVLGQLAAFMMTWTRSFLNLAPAEPLPIELTPDAWRRGMQMAGLLLVARLLPAFGAARYTIVSYKNERIRATQRPFWQRMFLDLLLLVAVYYGYTQLQLRGTIAILDFGSAADDPFTNPLLLLTPTLYILALALVAARFFPLLMSALAWLSGHMPGVAAVMALRYLARSPRLYIGPMLLLVLTLSLATFTASMAATLDEHLIDQVYYAAGSDMRVSDIGQSSGGTQAPQAGAVVEGSSSGAIDQSLWLFLPVSDYLEIPGVLAATRVGRSEVTVTFGETTLPALFLGIDRLDFPGVAVWRSDYAGEPLGALMNRLAEHNAAVLVSRSFAREHGLRIGDAVTVTMNTLGAARRVPMVIAGFTDLFPTAYPDDGPFLVGNLEYTFDQVGGQYPYEVWMRLEPGTSRWAVADGIIRLGLRTVTRAYAPADIAEERERPERQGLYGLLSVGFVAAAALTVLGFLFFSLLSFQRRFVELGSLRAIGLSARQLGVLLAWEQVLIIGASMLAGTLIGVSASVLFIPFLQVRGGEHPQIPPFLVQIAWDQITIIYLVFGLILLAAVLITLVLLRRMQLFQAIKLGEAV